MRVGDVDGDGDVDVISTTSSTGELFFHENVGTNFASGYVLFRELRSYISHRVIGLSGSVDVHVVDVDNDGRCTFAGQTAGPCVIRVLCTCGAVDLDVLAGPQWFQNTGPGSLVASGSASPGFSLPGVPITTGDVNNVCCSDRAVHFSQTRLICKRMLLCGSKSVLCGLVGWWVGG
jgi:hypothetical protein